MRDSDLDRPVSGGSLVYIAAQFANVQVLLLLPPDSGAGVKALYTIVCGSSRVTQKLSVSCVSMVDRNPE